MDTDPRPPDPAAASGVSAPADVAAGRGPPRRRARRAWLAVAALALLLGVALLAPWAMLRSTAGTAWLLARLPGVVAEGVQGALLGDRLALQRLRWQGAAGTLGVPDRPGDGALEPGEGRLPRRLGVRVQFRSRPERG